jgi:hypothetical protein
LCASDDDDDDEDDDDDSVNDDAAGSLLSFSGSIGGRQRAEHRPSSPANHRPLSTSGGNDALKRTC